MTFQKIKERHQCKFNKLRERLLDRQGSDERDLNLRPSWVVNLSDRQLSTTEKAVLSKGPHFAVSPEVNAVDIAAPVEAALQTSEASDQAKESARIKICEAIGRAKKPTRTSLLMSAVHFVSCMQIRTFRFCMPIKEMPP